MALTGRFTFRRSFGGKIVLQVEEEVRTVWPWSKRTPLKKRWRDASLMDLAAPELRALIDLRHKPQFMAQYEHLGADESKRQLSESRPEEGRDGGPQSHPLESSIRRPDVIVTPDRDLAVEIERQSTRGPNLVHSNRMR